MEECLVDRIDARWMHLQSNCPAIQMVYQLTGWLADYWYGLVASWLDFRHTGCIKSG